MKRPLAEPRAEPGGGAGVADPCIIGGEGAVTLELVVEGLSSPEGAVGGRFAVGQVVSLADESGSAGEHHRPAS